MRTTHTRIHSWKMVPPLLGLLIAAAVSGAARAETEWRIGLAAVRITPEEPILMCGYSPVLSEGVLDDLYAKAMAIEDGSGSCAVLLTADLLFFRAPLAEALCKNESFGYLPTAKILQEGGHETIGLTLAVGFFSPEVQDVVIAAVRQIAQR